jgi:hypothetical protein
MEISDLQYQTFLDSQQIFVGVGISEYIDLQAREIAERHLEKLNGILQAIREIPGLKIFGSALTRIPGDIDVFYDMRNLNKTETRFLMSLTRQFFPTLDPFVVNRQGDLFCRSASSASRAENLNWILAKNAKTLIKAGLTGVRLVDFKITYCLPDNLVEPPFKEPLISRWGLTK